MEVEIYSIGEVVLQKRKPSLPWAWLRWLRTGRADTGLRGIGERNVVDLLVAQPGRQGGKRKEVKCGN